MSEDTTPDTPDAMTAAVEHSFKELKANVAELSAAAAETKASAAEAKLAAASAEKTAGKWRRWSIIQSVVIVALVAVSAVTGYFVNQTRTNTDGLRQQSIQSCQIGNQRAAGTVAAVDFLVDTLEGPHPTAAIKALANSVKAQVLKDNEPRNCSQAYQAPAGAGVNPTSGSPVKAVEEASSTTTVYPENWNGYCLSIPNANVGTRVEEVPCASAHAWTYYSPSAELSPQGHPNVALGDSGGYPVLKATPTTDVTGVGPNKTGPGDFSYFQMNLGGNAGYYVHGNGNGQWVTLDNINGDGYNYWAFTVRGTGAATQQTV